MLPKGIDLPSDYMHPVDMAVGRELTGQADRTSVDGRYAYWVSAADYETAVIAGLPGLIEVHHDKGTVVALTDAERDQWQAVGIRVGQ